MRRAQEEAGRKMDADIFAARQKFDPRELEPVRPQQEVLPPASGWYRQVYNERYGSW